MTATALTTMKKMTLKRTGLVLVVLALAAVATTARAATCKAFDFGKRAKSRIVFQPTSLIGQAGGHATIQRNGDRLTIDADIDDLASPGRLGAEYFTYVLWSVTPDGKSTNLGDLTLDGHRARITTPVPAGSFGLIVTAEPYATVPEPSDRIVLTTGLEGRVARDLKPTEWACYLVPAGRYSLGRTREELALLSKGDPKTPSLIIQARNALDIAKREGAAEYAAEALQQATRQLLQAEDLYLRRTNPATVTMAARSSLKAAEEARSRAVTQRDEARVAEELRVAQARETEALAAEESRRQAELRATAEQQLEQERQKREDAERRLQEEARLRGELAKERSQPVRVTVYPSQSTTPFGVAYPSSPQPADPSVAFEARQGRLDAERASLDAERAKMQADFEVERAALLSQKADLEAKAAAERASRDQSDGTTRAQLEEARFAAERARLEAEAAKHEAELAAQRAALAVDRARMEADVRIRESERASALAASAPPPTAAPADSQEQASERARIEAELAQQKSALEAERIALAAERAKVQLEMEAEKARLQADTRVREAQLEAERKSLERSREDTERIETSRRREAERQMEAEQKAVLETRKLELEAEFQKRQEALEADRAAVETQRAEVEQRRSRLEAEEQRRVALARERADRRAKLLEQLTAVLEAQDSERGLVVRMPDISFPPGQYALRPEARESLSRIAGILAVNSGIQVEVEGHTDSTGSAEVNRALSEKRAAAVRDYLTQQGVSPAAILARGYGASLPVASNEDPAGRRKNRRVELVISGEAIDPEAEDALVR